jgi:Ni,Fe-hydrogenase I large subunit
VSRTRPDRAKAGAYGFIKAPRWNGKACEVGALARMAVAGLYPVTANSLASVVPGYLAYVKSGGLDPKLISADLAVGMIQSGLAALQVGAGAPITDVSAMSRAAVLAAYTSADAVLTGTAVNWLLGLKGGLSTMDRLRARALDSFVLAQAVLGGLDKSGATVAFTGATIAGTSISAGWIRILNFLTGTPALDFAGSTWRDKAIPAGAVEGWGVHEAGSGALMHHTALVDGKVTRHQCVAPATWNGSPKDGAGNRGAAEQALMGVPCDATSSTFTNQAGGSATTWSSIE